MKIIRVLTFISLCMIMVSCGYEEGEMLADEAFSKMNTKELLLYKSVEAEWWSNPLFPIRDAARKRHVKPTENRIPFQDIADVIKLNNNVTLFIDERKWSTDKQKEMTAKKWSGIDPEWYNTIVNITNSGKPITTKQIKRSLPRNEKPKNTSPKSSPQKNIKIISSSQDDDYLSIEELNELKYEMKKCQIAQNLFNSIVSKGKPLTYSDRDELSEKILICEAEEINNKFREE